MKKIMILASIMSVALFGMTAYCNADECKKECPKAAQNAKAECPKEKAQCPKADCVAKKAEPKCCAKEGFCVAAKKCCGKPSCPNMGTEAK
ncbi:MAG: hypothetical protein IKO42_03250 [Opitutales bacterium]|nr:hypothetical protein [Opitutales bacterium]